MLLMIPVMIVLYAFSRVDRCGSLGGRISLENFHHSANKSHWQGLSFLLTLSRRNCCSFKLLRRTASVGDCTLGVSPCDFWLYVHCRPPLDLAKFCCAMRSCAWTLASY